MLPSITAWVGWNTFSPQFCTSAELDNSALVQNCLYLYSVNNGGSGNPSRIFISKKLSAILECILML